MATRMMLDLVALALLLLFAALGARRGAIATGCSVVGLACGYFAAWRVATRFGGVAAEELGIAPLLAAPLAGSAAFVVVASSFAIAGWLLRRGAEAPSLASRAGGALFGALRGSLLALGIGVAALWLDALRDAGEPTVDTPLRAVTRAAVEGGVEVALGDDAATRLAARALARPAEAIGQIRALAETPELQALMADASFWAYVEADALDAALAQPAFQRLQWNAERRHQVAALGLVDEASAGDPALFALELRGALAQVGPRLRSIRNDPDLARLAEDPAVAEMAARRDVVGLLSHPGLQRVLSRALAQGTDGERPASGAHRAGTPAPPSS